MGICPEATETLRVCLDGVLICGGWDQAPYQHSTGPRTMTRGRRGWCPDCDDTPTGERPGVLVSLRLTLQNHSLLFSLLGAWQDWPLQNGSPGSLTLASGWVWPMEDTIRRCQVQPHPCMLDFILLPLLQLLSRNSCPQLHPRDCSFLLALDRGSVTAQHC